MSDIIKGLILTFALLCCAAQNGTAAEEIYIEDSFIRTDLPADMTIQSVTLGNETGFLINGKEIRGNDPDGFDLDIYPFEPVNESSPKVFVPIGLQIYRGTQYQEIEQWDIVVARQYDVVVDNSNATATEFNFVLEGYETIPSNVTQSVWVRGIYYLYDETLGVEELTDSDGNPVSINATRQEWNNWEVEVTYL